MHTSTDIQQYKTQL